MGIKRDDVVWLRVTEWLDRQERDLTEMLIAAKDVDDIHRLQGMLVMIRRVRGIPDD